MSTLSNKKQDDVKLRVQETSYKVRETGQLRRAKMHASCLIENVDNNNALTPALRELLETSLTLQTISTKILAAHLHRSPATIRSDFQRILTIIGKHNQQSLLGKKRINFQSNIRCQPKIVE